MKGIILAGGSGTRLYPLTKVTSKQLLPIYDKPMIYYPLSVLMLAGIKDILMITTPEDKDRFEALFGDGSFLGLNITYKVQPKPEGLAQAFLIGEEFIGDDDVCLVLGDNIFYGDMGRLFEEAKADLKKEKKATIFGYEVQDANRYGVVAFDENQNVTSIEEKPEVPKSNYAVSGLYFYPNSVIEVAKKIVPSSRGELEITDVNKHFLEDGKLSVQLMDSRYMWLDTGTHESLMEASDFVQTIEKRTGKKVACIEEIAFLLGYITRGELLVLADALKKNQYGRYLIDKYTL